MKELTMNGCSVAEWLRSCGSEGPQFDFPPEAFGSDLQITVSYIMLLCAINTIARMEVGLSFIRKKILRNYDNK